MESFSEAVSCMRRSRYQPVVDILGFVILFFAISEFAYLVLSEDCVVTSQREFIIMLLLVLFFVVGLANTEEWTADAKGAKTPACRQARRTRDAASNGGCLAKQHGQHLQHQAPCLRQGSTSGGRCVSTGSSVEKNSEFRRLSPNFIELDQVDSDIRLLEDAQREGVVLDASNYSAMLAACARQSHAGMAVKLFKYMLEKGVVCNHEMVKNGVVSKFFRVVAQSIDEQCMQDIGVELIEAIRAHGIEPVHLVQNRLICAWRSKPPMHVLEMFMTLREQGYSLSPTAYRCIMAANERTKPHLTLDLYEEMANRGSKIDRVAFNAALCACSHLGRTSQAMALFETMRCRGLAPNGKTYGTLIRIYTAADKAEEAVNLFETMRAESFEPNRFAFDDAIHCYVGVQRLGKAVSLYQEMLQAGVRPCGATGQYLSRMCQKQGRTELADQILLHQDCAGGTAWRERAWEREPLPEPEDDVHDVHGRGRGL